MAKARSARSGSLVGSSQAPKADPWDFRSVPGGQSCVFNGTEVATIRYNEKHRKFHLVYPPEEWWAPSAQALRCVCRAIHQSMVSKASAVTVARATTGWRGWFVRRLIGSKKK